MSGDVHVPICEGLGVKFPRATRLHRPFTAEYFLKSSGQESISLYQIKSENPQKIIFTIPFYGLTSAAFVIALTKVIAILGEQ
jgi:hypothetical protein